MGSGSGVGCSGPMAAGETELSRDESMTLRATGETAESSMSASRLVLVDTCTGSKRPVSWMHLAFTQH